MVEPSCINKEGNELMTKKSKRLNKDQRREKKKEKRQAKAAIFYLGVKGREGHRGNYLPEALRQNDALVAKRGKGLYHSIITHDDWCQIHKGGECNCNPTVETVTDEEYMASHHDKLYGEGGSAIRVEEKDSDEG